jgi:hypothetical protein
MGHSAELLIGRWKKNLGVWTPRLTLFPVLAALNNNEYWFQTNENNKAQVPLV